MEEQPQQNQENPVQQNPQKDPQQIEKEKKEENIAKSMEQNLKESIEQAKNIKDQIEDLKAKVKETENQREELIKTKIRELVNAYVFAMNYSGRILNLIRLFDLHVFEKVGNSIRENNNFIKFFKDIIDNYTKFSADMTKINSTFTSSPKLPCIVESDLRAVMATTQKAISNNFTTICNSLKVNLLTKACTDNLEKSQKTIETLKTGQEKKMQAIESERAKLKSDYEKKYFQIFYTFLPIDDPQSAKLKLPPLQNKMVDSLDFVLIIIEFFKKINDLIVKTNLFVNETKDDVYKVNQQFVIHSNLIKNAVSVYITEMKKIFSGELTKELLKIEEYYQQMNVKQNDQKFKILNIFPTPENKDEINKQLKEYQVFLVNSKRAKKELVEDNSKFLITTYDDTNMFFEFLLASNPQPTDINTNNLILASFTIQRDPGVFHSWRDCVVLFTIQKHIILFDNREIKTENLVGTFEVDKLSLKKKIDKKRPSSFSLVVERKGRQMNFGGTWDFDARSEETYNQILDKFKFLANLSNSGNNP